MSSVRRREHPWILYSTSDEDATSELAALAINTDDYVFCVTGSGCRTLSLLAQNPRAITSVDYSPGQNHLLELKLHSIRSLSYDALLEFLGVRPSSARSDVYKQLARGLSGEARSYFDRFASRLARGILYQGRHEQFYARLVAPAMNALYGKHLTALFAADTISEQVTIYEQHIRGPLWNLIIGRGFSLPILKFVLNNPHYHIEVHVGAPGAYMLARFDHTMRTHLARDNDWLSLMLRGRYHQSLPHFLWPQSYEGIRAATTNLVIKTGNVIDLCRESPPDAYTKFSLSDVTSCISRTEFEELLRQIARAGRSDGRVCIRNFLAGYKIPGASAGVLVRDDAMSAQLDVDDKAFVYTFEVATLCKGSASNVSHSSFEMHAAESRQSNVRRQ